MTKTRIAALALLLAALLTTQGCTYLQNRADDAMDIIDFGFTFSAKPQLNLFVDAPGFTTQPIGWGKLDCVFLGLGQGKFSAFAPAHFNNWGLLLYGDERVTYEGYEADMEKWLASDDEQLIQYNWESHTTGIGGIAAGIADGRYIDKPRRAMKYIGSCPHNFHLLFFGIVATPRYWEMLDLIVGFTTLDLSNDDDAAWQNEHFTNGWYAVRLPK